MLRYPKHIHTGQEIGNETGKLIVEDILLHGQTPLTHVSMYDQEHMHNWYPSRLQPVNVILLKPYLLNPSSHTCIYIFVYYYVYCIYAWRNLTQPLIAIMYVLHVHAYTSMYIFVVHWKSGSTLK